MQSFLGTVVICSGFIPDYSVRAIPLYNMTTASYDWSTAWSDKELLALEDIKQGAAHYTTLMTVRSWSLRQMPPIMDGGQLYIRLVPTK